MMMSLNKDSYDLRYTLDCLSYKSAESFPPATDSVIPYVPSILLGMFDILLSHMSHRSSEMLS